MIRVTELVAVALLAMLLAAACSATQADELQTESGAVELGDAESVRTNLKMAAGELKVGGSAEGLMEADFAYTVADWNPEVSYDDVNISGTHHYVEVSGYTVVEVYVPLVAAIVPHARVLVGLLDAEDACPTSDFDLSGLNLTGFDLRVGAGPSTVDLAGDWDRDVDASIKGGTGTVRVRLPSRMGVRVDVEGGLGEVQAEGLSRDGDTYVNDAYDESEATLNLDIEGGVGAVRLEVA